MGFYFEKASKDLLDSLQSHRLFVNVWNGQKVVETTTDKLSFTFSHGDADNMFSFSSVTYVLEETDLFDGTPTIYSNSNSSKAVTYIIPRTKVLESFKIESGPNANRIICLGISDMKKVLKSVMAVI